MNVKLFAKAQLSAKSMRNVCCYYCGMPAKRVTALSNAANRPHACPSQESCDWKDVDLYLIKSKLALFLTMDIHALAECHTTKFHKLYRS